MPVRMTEIPPQTPSGVTKVNVEMVDIATETSFDAELNLMTPPSVEGRAESREFAQVGQILRKMLPLEVQIAEQKVEPVSIDVEPPIAVTKPDVPQKFVSTEVIARPKAELIETSNFEPQTVEAIPLRQAEKAQTPNRISAPDVPENATISNTLFAAKILNHSQATHHPIAQKSEMKPATEPVVTRPQPNAPPSVTPAPPEAKPRVTADVQQGFSEVGPSVSEKPQALRAIPNTAPTVQPTASQPQPVEAKVISQISTAISATAKDTVEIRLDPPELGRVVISITQSDSGLSATVISEKPEIADLLRRHSELLARELAKSGFGEASLEFSHRDQRHDRSVFEEDAARYPSTSPEPSEAISSIESILLSQPGSLDIRL